MIYDNDHNNTKIRIIKNIQPEYPTAGKEGQHVVNSLDHLYEKAEREYNLLRSNWEWFVTQGKQNRIDGCLTAIWARVDQN